MNFLAVFVAVLAVAAAAPRRVHIWNVNELSEAINNPNTDPALRPYLVDALNNLMEAISSGSPISVIPVVTPIGVGEPVQVAGILPGGDVAPGTAIEVAPVVPGGAAEVAPIAVAPVAAAPDAEAASGKPLVQLIININAQAQEAVSLASVAEVPVAPVGVIELAPVGVIEHAPVEAAEKPVVAPTPVNVIEMPVVVAPTPVSVVDAPEVISPVAVIDMPQVVSPVVVVDQPAVAEPVVPVAVNPVDVISVSPPEFNPVDVISPVPAVESGSNSGILV